METRKVDLNSFFSTSAQEEGVWFEPKVGGVGIGIEFKVTGKESLRNQYTSEVYAKKLQEIEAKETDPLERLKKSKEATAQEVASFVVGVRGKDGVEVTMDGKPLEFSLEAVAKLFYENYDIQNQVVKFSFDLENFLNRKK